MVEHTLHILLLPGLHSSTQHHPNVGSAQPEASSSRSLSLPSTHIQQVAHQSTLGMDLSLPSPFHLRLPITSRLSFNDAGRITHHRDLWDVKVRNAPFPRRFPFFASAPWHNAVVRCSREMDRASQC